MLLTVTSFHFLLISASKLPAANVKIYMYCNPLEEQLTTYLNSDRLIYFPAEVHGKTIST